jgi:hypothetical protein
MRTIETVDVGYDIRTLRDDELDGVSGGRDCYDLGIFGRLYFANAGAVWCTGTAVVNGGDGVSCSIAWK